MDKKGYIKLSLLVFSFSFSQLMGQNKNFVKNFDFSNNTACPTTMSQLSFLTDWQTGLGTADYFDLCGVGYGGAPNHPWGYQMPHSDSGFVNFGYGESFKQTLSSTIKAGQSVYYEYYVTRGENGQYAMYKFGIQFKMNGQTIQKEIYTDTLVESVEWIPISGCFIAPSDINEIEVGYISGVTGKVLIDASKTFSQAYCYVDDIKVIPGYILDLGNDTAICMGDSVEIDSKIVAATYLWNTSETTQFIYAKGTGSTSFSNDYSVQISLGVCTWQDTINIQFKTPPVVTLGSDQVICSGQSITLDAGNSGATYQWSNGKTTEAISVNTSNNYTVAVTYGSCTGYDTILVSTITPPSVNLGKDTSLCSGQTLSLDASNPGLMYTWSTGDATQTIVVSDMGTSSFGSGNYWVNVSNGICSVADTIAVQFIPNPSVNLGNDQSFCQGQSITLDAGNAGSTYLWSTAANTQSITVSTSGNYYVGVTKNGCSGADTVTITFNPAPIVNLGSDTGLCKGESIVLDAGNSGANYLWSNGSTSQTLTIKDTMFVSGGYFSVVATEGQCTDEDTIFVAFYPKPVVSISDTAFCEYTSVTFDATYTGATAYKWSTGAITPTINVSAQGQYSVIINNNGCSGYDTTNAYLIQVPKIDLGKDTILCDGDSLKLDVGNSGTAYNWSNGSNANSIEVNTAGQYSIIVQNNYCYSYDTVNISYQLYPTVGLGGDFSFCDGGTATISTAYSGALYTWSTGESSQGITINSTGDYWLIVDMNHCRDTDTVSVNVFTLPVFELGENKSLCPGEEATIAPNVNADVFIWVPNLINGSSATIADPGTYTVTAVDSNGCSYTDSITFDDYCPTVVYVPLSFTPNGDQKNDVFMPKGNNVYAFNITIFDRWGNTIFYSDDLDKGWDGTINGNPAGEDTYSWKIYYEGERENNIGLQKQMMGSVTLFR